MRQRQTGFTLIELLVVMAILVLLSVISYRALVTALDTRQVVDRHSEQLREFELGLFLLRRDFQQVQIAPLPTNRVAFRSDFGEGEHDEGRVLTLMRAPDAQQLQGVTPVSYTLAQGQLWQHVGDEDAPHAFRTPILSGITSVSVAFDDARGQRFYTWQQPTPPDVVTLTLNHQRYGAIVIKARVNGL